MEFTRRAPPGLEDVVPQPNAATLAPISAPMESKYACMVEDLCDEVPLLAPPGLARVLEEVETIRKELNF